MFVFVLSRVFLREREYERVGVGVGVGDSEEEAESQADSVRSIEPDMGLDLKTVRA